METEGLRNRAGKQRKRKRQVAEQMESGLERQKEGRRRLKSVKSLLDSKTSTSSGDWQPPHRAQKEKLFFDGFA